MSVLDMTYLVMVERRRMSYSRLVDYRRRTSDVGTVHI